MRKLLGKGINLVKESGPRAAIKILIGIMVRRVKRKLFELVVYQFVGTLWRKLDKMRAWLMLSFLLTMLLPLFGVA